MKNEQALAEIALMERNIATLAAKYELQEKYIPKVIGANNENAWVGTKYLVAWGSELETWQKSSPRQGDTHYISKADPADLGSLHEFELHEGRKVNENDLRRIALTVGRHREMESVGVDPKTNPLWSFAASTFAKAVIQEELKRHGKFDLSSKNIKMDGPIIGLSFRSPWVEHTDEIDRGSMSISGTVLLPKSLLMGLGNYKGRPLSDLISGKTYESMTIQSVHAEESFLDDDSDEVSLTIFINGKIERLGRAPKSIQQDNPIEGWLAHARN